MISVRQAQEIVLNQARLMPAESVDLSRASGRVLREVLYSDRDQPAFHKSTMDGIAVSSAKFNNGQRSFKIHTVIAAGMPAPSVKDKSLCCKIMTGAVVPDGYDAVIPIEYVRISGGNAQVSQLESVKSGWNIRFKGQDCPKGHEFLVPGHRLLPSHIAAAASIGKALIKVSRKPKIAIISTGDELVEIAYKKIKPYQVRMSNAYALASAVEIRSLGETTMFHLKDDPRSLLRELRKILATFDVLVLSGGVSMGDFDHVPKVLEDLKVRRLFHKVAQKPGKPFWFGKTPSRKVVFALPGNPVSTLVCAYRYLLPFLNKSAGLPIKVERTILAEKCSAHKDMISFIPVTCVPGDIARRAVRPVATGGSGDSASLTRSDGFIEVGPDGINSQKGSAVDFYPW